MGGEKQEQHPKSDILYFNTNIMKIKINMYSNSRLLYSGGKLAINDECEFVE